MAKVHKSLQGHLLLDGGQLRGSWFHRTVVLVCQHDPDGAFGLVLNRDSGRKVGEALDADLPDSIKEQALFIGGPVQPTAMSYLVTDEFLPDANVMPNLSLGHSQDELIELAQSFSPTQRLRLFAGYAGWSPGQLDDEIKRKAWLVHPATLRLVFDVSPEALWKAVLLEKGPAYQLLAHSPEDPSVN